LDFLLELRFFYGDSAANNATVMRSAVYWLG
jgi:hypothetical protein